MLSSLCAQLVAKDPSFLHADSKDSDQTGRMLRLICLRWAHMPFCWFCHEAAHLFLWLLIFDGIIVSDGMSGWAI